MGLAHAAATTGSSFRRFRLTTPAAITETTISTGRGSRNVAESCADMVCPQDRGVRSDTR